MNAKPDYDPLDAYRACLRKNQETEALRAEVKRLKDAAAAADKQLTDHNKSSRDEARAQARRAQFAGEVFLALATQNADLWEKLRPYLDATLETADDDHRLLFDLPPLQRTDSEEASKAAAPDAKQAEPKPEPAQQPAS